jgi:hypothetical protein
VPAISAGRASKAKHMPITNGQPVNQSGNQSSQSSDIGGFLSSPFQVIAGKAHEPSLDASQRFARRCLHGFMCL